MLGRAQLHAAEAVECAIVFADPAQAKVSCDPQKARAVFCREAKLLRPTKRESAIPQGRGPTFGLTAHSL